MTPVAASAGSLAGAPVEYQVPAVRPTLAEAKGLVPAPRDHALRKTSTWQRGFLPTKVRSHFESVYAYCRVSDDLGDEVADSATALRTAGRLGRNAG